MGRNSNAKNLIGGPIGRTTTVMGLAVAVVMAVSVSPAAASPTVTATDTTDVVTGSVIHVEVDGTGGYDGAAILVVSACGNAATDGTPLSSTGLDDCWGIFELEHLQIQTNPVDGDNYSFDYTWDNVGIGVNDTTCVADGTVPCTVAVALVDSSFNPFETIFIPVSPPGGAPPKIIPGATSVEEGDTGTTTALIPVALSRPSATAVSADWTLHDFEATSPDDYVAASGTVTFDPDSTFEVVSVSVVGDAEIEPDERFVAVFTNAINGQIGGYYGVGAVTILDDDAPPHVIPGFASSPEGDSGSHIVEVPVSLSEPSANTVTVDWETLTTTATEGVDFIAASGQLEFLPGETEAIVELEIIGDTEPETDEVAVFVTSNWVNAIPGGFYGVGGAIIIDDEHCDNLVPNADLHNCDFSGEVFAGTDLHGANLTGANLAGAQLINVDLSSATLDGADLTDTILASSTLDGASALDAVLDGATAINNSMIGVELANASIDGAIIVGGDVSGILLDGSSIQNTSLLVGNLDDASLLGVTWGAHTVCPDGSTSGTHRDTCWRVGAFYAAQSGLTEPVIISDLLFGGVFVSGTNFEPGDAESQAVFGGPVNGVSSIFRSQADIDNDGTIDLIYVFNVAGAPLIVGTQEYCMDASLLSGDAVYGCAEMTVVDPPPPTTTVTTTTTMPPISPPASPPTSPPISGVGGTLAGLLPLFAGPVGLMATASGIGLIFLLGSTRATSLLETDTRKDDEEPDDLDS